MSKLSFLLCTFMTLAAVVVRADDEKITFVDHVQPILREHCFVCHDADGASGGLAVDSMAALMAGGASGDVLEPGSADSSRLFRVVSHQEGPTMPPDQDKIAAEQIEILRKWIDGGLLETASSVAKLPKKSAVGEFTPTADNRPEGEPAMPQNVWCEPVISPEVPGAAQTVAASPWAPLVAVGGQRQVSLYRTDSRQLVGVLPFLEGVPQVVRFSRNGDLLLVAGGRGASLGVAALFDVKTGRRLTTLGDEVDVVLAADVLADHSLVAIGGPRRKVRVFRTADGAVLYEIAKHTDWVTALEFSPDGKLLVTSDRSGNSYLWEAPTGRLVSPLGGHGGPVTGVSWRADSQLVATASDDGNIKIHRADGREFKSFGANGGGTLAVAFSAKGNVLAAGRDRRAKLFDTQGKELTMLAEMPDIALAIAATPDETLAVVGDYSGEVRLVDIASKQPVGTLATNPPSLAVQIEQQLAAQSQLDAQRAEAQAKVEQLAQTLATQQQQLADMQQELATSRQLAEAASAKADETNQAMDAARTKSEQLKSTVDDSRAKVSELQTKLSELQKQLADMAAIVATDNEDDEAEPDTDEAKRREADLQKQVEATTAALDAARTAEQTAAGELKQARETLEPIRTAARDARQALAEAQKRHKAAEQAMKNPPDVAVSQQALDTERQQLAASEERLAQLASHVQQLRDQQQAFADEPAQLDNSLSTQSTTVEQLAATMKLAEESEAATQTQLDALEKQLAELKLQLGAARDQKKTTEAELSEAAAQLEATQRRLAERQAIEELRQRVGK
jgi:hypothetical protein